jgi:ABC-2 type transport system ATP-binding protein
MTAVIHLERLTKSYGRNRGVVDLELEVEPGCVFGFLGPNGAGKTTTLRILAGLARPTSGAARVLGHDVTEAGGDVRAVIGFLPDVPAFYKWMTAPQYLRFAGSLFGLRGDVLEARVAALLDLAGLTEVGTRIGGFSRGMKQRLGVAQALVNAPRLLLLDEPTSALDPIGRREVLDMVAALRGRTTVFFSTHILADVERVCDTVAIIDHGRVAAHAPIDELRLRRGGLSRLAVEVDEPQRLAAALEGAAWLRAIEVAEDGGLRLATDDLETAQRELPALVARLGLALRRLESDELSLEDVFVDLVEGERR